MTEKRKKKKEKKKKTQQQQQQKNKQRQKWTTGDWSYTESIRAKWFSFAFNLGFLQLICKVSLIFKSNLELDLSIILKQRELYDSKHIAMECRCLNIWDLLSFLYVPQY